MTVDLAAAARFMTTHARLLERRRFEVRFAGGAPEAALAALAAYRNRDGGYGSGIEPDLRDRRSQPVGAMHAFEVLEDAAPVTTIEAVRLCDWLESETLPYGGLPFALPVTDPTGCAPFWAGADPTAASLHITAAVTAAAVRVARHDPAVADHPWLAGAIRWCLDAIAAADGPTSTLELRYSLGLLDALGAGHPEAPALTERWATAIPDDGYLPVEGGLPDERIGPRDLAPWPDSLARPHLPAAAVADDLDRLAGAQNGEGGWEVDFHPYSPAAALEWNGYYTVWALQVLQANGRID